MFSIRLGIGSSEQIIPYPILIPRFKLVQAIPATVGVYSGSRMFAYTYGLGFIAQRKPT